MQPQIHTEQNEENITPEIPFAQPQMPILAELLCSEESDHDLIESGAEGGGGGGDRSLEHCDETTVLSYFDSSILHHPDVMSRLKFLESQIGTPKNYFMGDGKPEILPYMRKVVASWMLEVSFGSFSFTSPECSFLIICEITLNLEYYALQLGL